MSRQLILTCQFRFLKFFTCLIIHLLKKIIFSFFLASFISLWHLPKHDNTPHDEATEAKHGRHHLIREEI